MDESLQSTLTYIRAIADAHGLALNPNDRQLEKLVGQLARAKSTLGEYVCPCKRSFPHNPAVDPVCPCDGYLEDVKRLGHCDCGLFFNIEATVQAKRRPGLLATVTCPG